MLSIPLRMFRRTPDCSWRWCRCSGLLVPRLGQSPCSGLNPPVPRALPVEEDNEPPPDLRPVQASPSAGPARPARQASRATGRGNGHHPGRSPGSKGKDPSIVPPAEIIREGKAVAPVKSPGRKVPARQSPWWSRRSRRRCAHRPMHARYTSRCRHPRTDRGPLGRVRWRKTFLPTIPRCSFPRVR